MPALLVPSAQIAFIDWMKTNDAIKAAFGGNGEWISASMPVRNQQFPWAEVRRITGLPQLAATPMDFARIQINVWGGRKPNGLPNWVLADEPARIIQAESREFRGHGTAEAFIAEIDTFEGMQQLEDPETHDARFWMDVLCVVRRADGQ